jgi:hypothetical protein
MCTCATTAPKRRKTSRTRSAIPFGPIYFTKAHIKHGLLSKKIYAQGPVASFYVNIRFAVESRRWTSAYRTVSSYVKCPSTTSGPSPPQVSVLKKRA